MSESDGDKLSRVRLMARGDATWDLSPNDMAAIWYGLSEIDRLRAENASLRAELKRRADLEPGGHVLDDDLRNAGVVSTPKG